MCYLKQKAEAFKDEIIYFEENEQTCKQLQTKPFQYSFINYLFLFVEE